LLMSTGVAYNEEKDRVQLFVLAGLHRFSGGYKGQSVRQAVLDPALQRSEPVGKRYAYASINSQALSMALQAAVKQPLYLYLQDKLWRPLGIPDEAKLLSDDEGEGFSLCCIYASPRSFAMLGQLMAQGGRWQGKQIVSSRWVARATTFADPQAWHARDVPRMGKTMNLFGFAYHWWPLEGDRGDFVAQGILGQSIYVSPRQNVVVVRLGHDETPGAHAEEWVALARAVADHLAPRGK
jgi:CubicO group peptidase (beta-lactamase class C family)